MAATFLIKNDSDPKRLIMLIMLNYARAKHFARLLRRVAVPVLAACATLAAAATTSVPVLRVTAPDGQQSILIGTVHVPVNGLHEPAQLSTTDFQRYQRMKRLQLAPRPTGRNR
ncbi:hypothetical protein M3A49_41390 [Paraburkholderia sp. CNPSo 3076]|uniref:hypothetical protein n=1 Tax=Paraburkholderia sp. CNPSo 3076 TaxID=2940936 RepID=UPI00225937A5|nr:hypothetical protein [Paraburkholderia sp. CNPSo 3076]MCX5545783.1 hypothetical protein [Paraburkholderia sp. CNPSo 3076]